MSATTFYTFSFKTQSCNLKRKRKVFYIFTNFCVVTCVEGNLNFESKPLFADTFLQRQLPRKTSIKRKKKLPRKTNVGKKESLAKFKMGWSHLFAFFLDRINQDEAEKKMVLDWASLHHTYFKSKFRNQNFFFRIINLKKYIF